MICLGSIYWNNVIPSLLQMLTAPLVGFAINSSLGRRGSIILFGSISSASVFLGIVNRPNLKSQKIQENVKKSEKILENLKEFQKILEN